MYGRAHFWSFTVIYLSSLFPRKTMLKKSWQTFNLLKFCQKDGFFPPFKPFEFSSGAALVRYNVIVSIPKTKTKD